MPKPLAATLALCLSLPAFAGGGDPGRATTPSAPTVSLTCSVTPDPKNGAGQFEMADYTVTVKSGSLAPNTKVELRLGKPGALSAVQTTVCSSSFQRGTATATNIPVTITIQEPYVWECTATATTKACDAPAVPN